MKLIKASLEYKSQITEMIKEWKEDIDRNKIQFDFICDDDSTCIPKEEIENLGGKVILIPPYQKVLKYHKELKKVLKNHAFMKKRLD